MARRNAHWLAGFPKTELVVCLVSLSVATWTWTRYSYCFRVTPRVLSAADAHRGEHSPWHGRYVEVVAESAYGIDYDLTLQEHRVYQLRCGGAMTRFWSVRLRCPPDHPRFLAEPGEWLGEGVPVVWRGRVACDPRSRFGDDLFVDATAGRWRGESIGGLVLGAWGCFVFGLCLREWLVERRASAHRPAPDRSVQHARPDGPANADPMPPPTLARTRQGQTSMARSLRARVALVAVAAAGALLVAVWDFGVVAQKIDPAWFPVAPTAIPWSRAVEVLTSGRAWRVSESYSRKVWIQTKDYDYFVTTEPRGDAVRVVLEKHDPALMATCDTEWLPDSAEPPTRTPP